MTATPKQKLLHAAFGMLLCFAVSSIAGMVVLGFWGPSSREGPLAASLAFVLVIQAAMAIVFWKRWRPAAVGVLVFIGFEALWAVAAWLVLVF